MKKTALQLLLTLLVALSIAGCERQERAADGTNQTETMAPMAAQPAPTGTESMTQTVDVEDGRSDAEGGGITATSTVQTGTSPAAPAVKKKSGRH